MLVAFVATSGLWLVTVGTWQYRRARRACYQAMVARGVPSGLARRLAKEFPGLKNVLYPLWNQHQRQKPG